MDCIKIITDEDFGSAIINHDSPRIRFAARGILKRQDGKIAIFNKKSKNEYKLPGGGIDSNETPEDAFLREVLEETGCKAKIIGTLGIIEENRSHDNFKQISYVFVAKVVEDTGKLNLTTKEKDEGAQLLWFYEKKALNMITNCIDQLCKSKYENLYHSKFIVLRDRFILEHYMKKKEELIQK